MVRRAREHTRVLTERVSPRIGGAAGRKGYGAGGGSVWQFGQGKLQGPHAS